jgi:hypothetical protein
MKKKWKQNRFSGSDFKPQYYFGGSLCSTRAHRTTRPLSIKHPIHLVLRSSKAVGELSFWHKKGKEITERAIRKYSERFGIKILSCANVGNHLHIYLKLSNRFTYEKFIRALTGTICLQMTKWNKNRGENLDRFWDYRPYTRIVAGFKNHLTMKDYMAINQIEGLGGRRFEAKMFLLKQNGMESG